MVDALNADIEGKIVKISSIKPKEDQLHKETQAAIAKQKKKESFKRNRSVQSSSTSTSAFSNMNR